MYLSSMKYRGLLILLFAVVFCVPSLGQLTWESPTQVKEVAFDRGSVTFQFKFKNETQRPVVIHGLKKSAKQVRILGRVGQVLEAGDSGSIRVVVDTRRVFESLSFDLLVQTDNRGFKQPLRCVVEPQGWSEMTSQEREAYTQNAYRILDEVPVPFVVKGAKRLVWWADRDDLSPVTIKLVPQGDFVFEDVSLKQMYTSQEKAFSYQWLNGEEVGGEKPAQDLAGQADGVLYLQFSPRSIDDKLRASYRIEANLSEDQKRRLAMDGYPSLQPVVIPSRSLAMQSRASAN